MAPRAIVEGVDYPTARGIEQITLEHYRRAGNDMTENRINGIAPNNVNKWFYMAKGAAYLKEHPDTMRKILKWDKK